MKKRTTMSRMLGLLLSCVMVLTMAQIPSMTVHAEEGGVGGFVNRCYQVALGRAADPSGYADWTNQLTSGKSDGAYVAFGFVFSPEYTNSGKDNAAFVTDMYTLFLGRTPDPAGFNDWVGQLNNGADRQTIFAGFANSNEFYNICTSYGVTAGVHVPGYDRTQVNNVNMFVARMYRVCLNRLGDKDGQNDWVNRLLHGELSGTDCAHGFIYSKEYQNLGLSNEAYVENMYTAFMGRHSDPTGFNDWVSKLNAGYTRDEIFAGFANSNEFQNICNSYGIVRGSYTPTNVHNGDITPTPTPAPEQNIDNPYVKIHGWRLKKETDYSGEYVLYNYTSNTDTDFTADWYAADNHKIGTYMKYSFDKNANKVYGQEFSYSSSSSGYTMTGSDYSELTMKNLGGNKYEASIVVRDNSKAITGYSTISFHVISGGEDLTDSEISYNKNKVVTSTTTYSYDSSNRLKETTVRNGSNVLTKKISYTYDANGTQTEITSYYKPDGKTVKSTKKKVTTYSNGHKKYVYSYDNSGKIDDTVEYVYDSYGNLVKETATGAGYNYYTIYEYEKF